MSNAIGRPPVVTWFVVYCAVFVVLYWGFALLCPFLISLDEELTRRDTMILGGIMAGLCFAFGIPFAIAPFLPRRSWVWIYDIVLICFGMTSICSMPAAIPLLIFWFKPETQAYFGRGVAVPPPSPPVMPGLAGL